MAVTPVANMPIQYDGALTEEVKLYTKELGSALTGIAQAERLNETLEEHFRPRDGCPAASRS
ncbi:MAG: hypothetical protein LBD18_03510 [Treponema sp.]|jgi:hypothetical protein|nr:hypothetical protein [Treponema sp.]